MGLNCGCPVGDTLPDLDIAKCKESLGQIQKVVFQRIYLSGSKKNGLTITSSGVDGVSTDAIMLASFTSHIGSKAGGGRILISPYIQNPTTEPGAARTFGGGNQTLGGVEIIIGREPTPFTGVIYQELQSTIKQLKQLQCENIGVYLIDENGNVAGLKDSNVYTTTSATTPTTGLAPIPIGKFFVGDKKLGGYEEPDSNTIEWSFFPNWSDDLVIVKPVTGFNPLTDISNDMTV